MSLKVELREFGDGERKGKRGARRKQRGVVMEGDI